MKVSAVSSTYGVAQSKNAYMTTVNQNSVNKSYKQNNELLDMNYGKALVNFGAAPNKNIYDLSDKVSAAYSRLTKNEILLVGSDIASAKKAMIDSAKSFKNLVSSVLFVAAPAMVGALAIRKNDNGFDELYNLSDKPLFIQRNEPSPLGKAEGNSDSFYINKGEAPAVLLDFDTISYKKGSEGFVLDKFMEKPDEVFENGSISTFEMPDLESINKKNLEAGIKVEEGEAAKNKIKLSDVGGQEEAIAQLKQKVLFPIKYPNFFDNNLKGFNSALLVGPPGTGKTLTAMALANEAGIGFYNVNGQLLESKYVGESAKNIAEYYDMAKQNQPCILFFDEADAIFGKRTGDHKYADDSVNMHLDKISELEKEGAKVFLLAATNHPELMDEGVLRNGRFGTKIEFKAPDTPEKCIQIFDIHSKGLNIVDTDKNVLAQKMVDAKFNGADIAALVTEAKYASIARQGIFDKMNDGTFKDDKDFRLEVKGEDFDRALNRLVENKRTVQGYGQPQESSNEEPKKNPIGFKYEKK